MIVDNTILNIIARRIPVTPSRGHADPPDYWTISSLWITRSILIFLLFFIHVNCLLFTNRVVSVDYSCLWWAWLVGLSFTYYKLACRFCLTFHLLVYYIRFLIAIYLYSSHISQYPPWFLFSSAYTYLHFLASNTHLYILIMFIVFLVSRSSTSGTHSWWKGIEEMFS